MDTCHICLYKSFNLNNRSICKTDNCFGYICKNCQIKLLDNGILICPLCNTSLYDIEDPESKKDLLKKINKIITIKDILNNIFIYLLFYSIGFSHIIASVYLIHNNQYISNSYESIYFMISLLIFPVIGIILWYCWIFILVFITTNCKSCIDKLGLNYDSDEEDI